MLMIALTLTATAALAHQGVKDPTVMARMHVMKDVGTAMKSMVSMAKGEVAFDTAQIAEARAVFATVGRETPEKFRDPATDPKSEALPVIWEQFDDFTAKAAAMTQAAEAFEPTSLAELQAMLPGVGGTCRDCHRTYRQKN